MRRKDWSRRGEKRGKGASSPKRAPVSSLPAPHFRGSSRLRSLPDVLEIRVVFHRHLGKLLLLQSPFPLT